MNENEVGALVVDSAVRVHRELGPGLLESVYEVILVEELAQRGLSIQRQVSVPIQYLGHHFDEGFRADNIVDGKVILELKSVEHLARVHKKQSFTYLKLKRLRPEYLLNFGAPLMKEGICRIINGLDDINLGVFGSSRENPSPDQK
jgi:GxxExxY protein